MKIRVVDQKKRGSGLTFGHDLDNQVVEISWHRAMPIPGNTPLEVAKAEVVSECQT